MILKRLLSIGGNGLSRRYISHLLNRGWRRGNGRGFRVGVEILVSFSSSNLTIHLHQGTRATIQCQREIIHNLSFNAICCSDTGALEASQYAYKLRRISFNTNSFKRGALVDEMKTYSQVEVISSFQPTPNTVHCNHNRVSN